MPAHIMLADVLPNILALAPYESVFGLACSCRALSRLPSERAQYAISARRKISAQFWIGDATGTLTHYPNGWRLRAHADTDRALAHTTVVYKNNVPVVAYVVESDITWTMSLVTFIYCMRERQRGYVRVTGWCPCHVGAYEDRVEHSSSVDDRVAVSIAVELRPLLVVPHHIVTADIIRASVKAMNVYARHIGNGSGFYDGVFCYVPGLLAM